MSSFHTPVLKDEVISLLEVRENGVYIDATAGGGGHTKLILEKGAYVYAIDQDQEALNEIQKSTETKYLNKLTLINNNFSQMKHIKDQYKVPKVDAVLFDLGTSRHQLDSSSRGFSFRKDAQLDMRMNMQSKTSAFNLINKASKETLKDIFISYGEELLSEQIADEIVSLRRRVEITTTTQLADLITHVYKINGIKSKIHPATKVFQALRIAVNDELNNLREGLRAAITILGVGGRIGAISYHSLEDRIVKKLFADTRLKKITKKPIRANYKEISANPAARSAKLRVAQKTESISKPPLNTKDSIFEAKYVNRDEGVSQ